MFKASKSTNFRIALAVLGVIKVTNVHAWDIKNDISLANQLDSPWIAGVTSEVNTGFYPFTVFDVSAYESMWFTQNTDSKLYKNTSSVTTNGISPGGVALVGDAALKWISPKNTQYEVDVWVGGPMIAGPNAAQSTNLQVGNYVLSVNGVVVPAATNVVTNKISWHFPKATLQKGDVYNLHVDHLIGGRSEISFSAVETDYSGTLSGAKAYQFVCKNITTKSKVVIKKITDPTAWDCTKSGLKYSPGDSLQTVIKSIAD